MLFCVWYHCVTESYLADFDLPHRGQIIFKNSLQYELLLAGGGRDPVRQAGRGHGGHCGWIRLPQRHALRYLRI